MNVNQTPTESAGGVTWDQLRESYEGRVTSEARGRFFSLLRATGWSPETVLQRLSCYVEFYRQLDWPLPTLAHVLDPRREQLADGNLRGLENEAELAKRRRR